MTDCMRQLDWNGNVCGRNAGHNGTCAVEYVPLADQTIDQLLETALWQATDSEGNPLDRNYDIAAFNGESRSAFIAEFRVFVNTYSESIDDYMSHTGRDWTDVAHDYALTRNHHGTGFWDRCYCGNDMQMSILTTGAEADGEYYVVIGDDGDLYIE